jgi:hypothetical protein
MRGDMIEVFKIINDIYDPLTTVDMFEINTTAGLLPLSASKSTSLMRDFMSLPEFDLMFMFAVKSYLHSW